MRVLLTTDGSLGASAAARTACRVFRAEDRQIELLYVEPEYPPRPAGFDNGSPGRFRVPSGLADAWHILGAAGSELSALGIHAARRAEIGWPPAVIANASADFDVTVVGSQGQGLHSAAGLGPVANHVLHHSTGSVLIGRELRRSGGIRV
ncbi:MAG TPA: universal stress protein, partial [Bryobacteraceae bacterium]|nr:universal stress protein [Bryobacteraceae bacterium]